MFRRRVFNVLREGNPMIRFALVLAGVGAGAALMWVALSYTAEEPAEPTGDRTASAPAESSPESSGGFEEGEKERLIQQAGTLRDEKEAADSRIKSLEGMLETADDEKGRLAARVKDLKAEIKDLKASATTAEKPEVGGALTIEQLVKGLTEAATSGRRGGVRPIFQKLLDAGESARELLAAQFKKETDEKAKVYQAALLVKLGDEEASRYLDQVMENEDDARARRRVLGAISMGRLVSKAPLVRRALGDSNFLVRSSAAGTLGELDGDDAVALLLETFLDEEEHGMVRAFALRTLSQLKDEEKLIPVYQKILDESENEMWVSTALQGIATIGGMHNLYRVEQVYNDAERSKNVRNEAARAGNQITGKESYQILK